MKKSENKPAPPADLRGVAAACKQRLEKELPVLRNMSGVLDDGSEHVFFRMPAVVHNLAVIDNRHIYMLLADLCALYTEVMSDTEWCRFAQSETTQNRLRQSHDLLLSLYEQEQAAQRREREQGNDDTECMQHVEYDLSCFFHPLMDLLSAGYIPSRNMRKTMHRLADTCRSLLRQCLQAKEKAYTTTQHIVSAE